MPSNISSTSLKIDENNNKLPAPTTTPHLTAQAVARRLSYSLFANPASSIEANIPQSPVIFNPNTKHIPQRDEVDAKQEEHIPNQISHRESSLHTPEKKKSPKNNDSPTSLGLDDSNSDSTPPGLEKKSITRSHESSPVSISINQRSPTEIELTGIKVENPQFDQVKTRPRTGHDKCSEHLANFLEQMQIPLESFNQSERTMLEIMLSPKTWKQKFPAYLKLPQASQLMARLLFYKMVHKKDLASNDATSGLTEKELAEGVLLHGSAIPLHDEQAIIRAYQITGFSNNVSMVGTVWSLLYLSLLVNALVLNYKFSDVAFEPYNLYQLFTDTGQSSKSSLSNSLSSYTIWPFLIGIPLIAGTFSMWRQGKIAKQKSPITDQADLDILEAYTSNLWLDHLRWFIPNHPVNGPLNRLGMDLIFNANKSVEHRNEAFEALVRFLAKAKGHTQLRAREVMAAIAFNISLLDLIEAKKIFPNADYTQVLKTIAKAHFNLTGASFSLKPLENEGNMDALIRAAFTRKLAYNQKLGHAGNLLLLFILYDLYISYSDGSLSLIIFKGIVKAFKNLDEMVKCKQADKVWVWRKESKDYECSVCGDDDQIAYRDIWTQDSCLDALLSRTQSAARLVNFFSSHRLQDITYVDFSGQLNTGWTPYHKAEELDDIFTAMNEHLPNISNFTFRGNALSPYLNVYPNSSYAGAPLGRFLAKAKHLKTANFSYLFLQENGIADLVANLSSTTLTNLDLNYNNAGDQGILALANVLPETQLVSLNVNNCESSDLPIPAFVQACFATHRLINIAYGASYTSDASAEELSKLLLKPNLKSLAVYSYLYTDVAIMFYASRLPLAKNLTEFGIEYFSMTNSSTIYALSDGLAETPNEKLTIQGYSSDPTIPGLGYFFYKLKDMPTSQLQIGGSVCVDETNAEAFSEYFPQSKVQRLFMFFCSNPPLSVNATQQFSNGIYRSNLTSLTLNTMDLTKNLEGNLQQIMLTPKLDFLELLDTGFSEEISLAIVSLLPKSFLRTFRITTNDITDAVLNHTATILSQTQLQVIRFGGDRITRFGIKPLFYEATLPGSNIESFEIYESHLDDEGASYMASRLPGSSIRNMMLETSRIGDIGAIKFAQALIKFVQYKLLWIDLLLQKDPLRKEPATQLTSLNLRQNQLGLAGASAIITNLPYTNIPLSNTDFNLNPNLTNINLESIEMTSSASRQATIPWPIQISYTLLFIFPKQLLTSLSEQKSTYFSPSKIIDGQQDEQMNSSLDLVSSLLMMLLLYQIVFLPLKKKLSQSSGFSFFNTGKISCTSNSEVLNKNVDINPN